MLNKIFKKRNYKAIDPDEIFLDSKNLPKFDTNQFEGVIEKPISSSQIVFFSSFFLLVLFVFIFQAFKMQVINGDYYKKKSDNNRLDSIIIFANRGLILDRSDKLLVWNDNNDGFNFSKRIYATSTGLSSTIGYVKYPTKDDKGFYYELDYTPLSGLEKRYQNILGGKNGMAILETDAFAKILSSNTLERPTDGRNLKLTVDKDLQKVWYKTMSDFSQKAGYRGGAGGMMDIKTGEILALVNFPEFDANEMVSRANPDIVKEYLEDPRNLFLNKFTSGLYTPGSIIKPFVALGALEKNIIDPNKNIYSSGELIVPNPYDKDKPSIFKDWKAHGYVDLRRAIAVSSNVYFYQISGGFEDQKGLGITNIEKYLRLFGFGQKTGIDFSQDQDGIIPNPEWKKLVFDGDLWRVGDTYNTSIGQYGVQITPIQALKAIGALANDGLSVTPTIVLNNQNMAQQKIDIKQENIKIVKEGMRKTVTEGTAKALNVPYVKISAKTGTAELGVSKSSVNSWIIGFFPSDKPKYAFVLVMEKGKANNQIGAALVMKDIFDYISVSKPEYIKDDIDQ